MNASKDEKEPTKQTKNIPKTFCGFKKNFLSFKTSTSSQSHELEDVSIEKSTSKQTTTNDYKNDASKADDENECMEDNENMSYLNKKYCGPLVQEIRRAKAERKSFQYGIKVACSSYPETANMFKTEEHLRDFINCVIEFLLTDNSQTGIIKMKELEAKIGKITTFDFNKFISVLTTCFVEFKMVDALLVKLLESMWDVCDVFVVRRFNCLCYIMGDCVVCAKCENTIYGKRATQWGILFKNQ
jgi:hypothetical protein